MKTTSIHIGNGGITSTKALWSGPRQRHNDMLIQGDSFKVIRGHRNQAQYGLTLQAIKDNYCVASFHVTGTRKELDSFIARAKTLTKYTVSEA